MHIIESISLITIGKLFKVEQVVELTHQLTSIVDLSID